MTLSSTLSPLLVHTVPSAETTPQLLIVEAPSGPARARWLEQRLQEMAAEGARPFLLSCDFDRGGPWAGANELLLTLLPEIRVQRPGLIQRHAYELVHALPELRRSVTVPNPSLTDIATDNEKTRNYPADRAFRSVSGLIDLLDTWKGTAEPATPWAIACDHYDLAGKIGSIFFTELMRRRSQRMQIMLLVAVTPGKAAQVRAAFTPNLSSHVMSLDCPSESAAKTGPEAAANALSELEKKIGDDLLEKHVQLSRLISLSHQAMRPDKFIRYRSFGLATYCTLGLYHDALRYGEGLLELAAQHLPDDDGLRWRIFMKQLNAYSSIPLPDAALKHAEGEGMRILEHAPALWHCQLYYMIGVLYARIRQPRDLKKGEEFLDRGLAIIENSDMAETERHFQTVFNRNGVAMIRSFQGRHEEAMELCQNGLTELNTYLAADIHRLHRSVLIYNVAQVYVAIRSFPQAIEYYTLALGMDPGYSEYHNERGNIYFRLGNLEAARADYLKAMELSPPYFEVLTNLGQCCRRLGSMNEAVEHFSRALDLAPDQQAALLGRAQVYQERGQNAAAIQDYTAVLQQDSSQWEIYANRGALHYQMGNLNASLADFDRAIELEPGQIELFQNRATLRIELGTLKEAAEDLRAALALAQNEEEKRSLTAEIEKLECPVENSIADAS